MHRGAEFALSSEESGVVGFCRRPSFLQHLADYGITLFCAAHGFDDIAEERRMHVAEVADAAAIVALRQQHVMAFRFG